ncbi:MAG: hypothetical protein Q8L68_02405 [Methylococcales bacterium]|nr:hypothetical protein [Methylococcales bacterium]
MENSKVKTIYPSKKSGIIQKIRLGLLGIGITFIVYTGYCWGIWGKNSLMLQYLFQCGCPLNSAESRYPDRVDVIVSACPNNSIVRLSPSGRFLFLGKDELLSDGNYIINLHTGEKSNVSGLSKGTVYFLNDEIMFHMFYGIDEYLLNLATGEQHPIQEFKGLRSDAYINGYANPNVLVESLQESENVFLVDDDIIVALASDFNLSNKNNFFVDRFDISGDSLERVEEFLLANNILFTHIPDYPEYLPEVVSPNGIFVAHDDGIYLAETKQKIVDGYPGYQSFFVYNGKYSSLYGWVYDSTGVIYANSFGQCLIRFGLPFMDGSECLIKVPQPVLKLKVPQEYLDTSIP